MLNRQPKPICRRTVLRGAGVALSLPLLEAMDGRAAWARESTFRPVARSAAAATPPRMICCYVPNGVNENEWTPNGNRADWQLSPTLRALQDVKSEVTVLTGLGHPNSKGGHAGADTWLTAADLEGTPGKDYRNSISVDQIAAAHHAEYTRFPSLELSDAGGTGSALHSHTLAFDRAGTPLPAENSPQRLFDRLFTPGDRASRAAKLQRLAERRSVLDEILQDANTLRRRLGNQDQEKLDEYLSSVRETERRVERLQNWVDVPRPDVPTQGLQLTAAPANAHDRPMWIDVMLELSYLAFQTDTTRVITFEWSREAGGFGGGGENHHELSHHGGDEGMLRQLATIDRFHVQRLSRFLNFLKATAEGDGVMLDRTMVLFGSGMNSGKGGGHSPKNLPLLLAGGRKLGLKQGQLIQHDVDSTPMSNVLLTMLQKMGVEQDRFVDSTGTLDVV